MPEAPDNRSISELDLSVRTHNCLMRAGIKTVSQLVALKESEADRIGGIGGVYWKGFTKELETNGIKLQPG